MKKLSLEGKFFNRWFVRSFSHMHNYNSYWNCVCSCGKEKIVQGSHLTSGKSASCGCYLEEIRKFIRKKEWNPNIIGDNLLGISLSNGREAIIDKEDYNKIKNFTWHVDNIGYAYTSEKRIRMHRLIINCPDEFEIDHINRNKLDNRKSNLRIVEHKRNLINCKVSCKNTSGYSGVSYNKRKRKYEVYLNINSKRKGLGYYSGFKKAIEISRKARINRELLYESRL
jgi:hypothetical protein